MNAPSFGFIGEQFFGIAPNPFKEIRVSVVVKMRFRIPKTIGEKYVGIIDVLIQFYHITAFKRQDAIFRFFKDPLKTSNIFGFKSQFYNAYQHLEEIYGYGVPVI